jgi:hypothetical protein
MGAGPLIEALAATALYAVVAPFADRSLIPDLSRLAHAKTDAEPVPTPLTPAG